MIEMWMHWDTSRHDTIFKGGYKQSLDLDNSWKMARLNQNGLHFGALVFSLDEEVFCF